VRECLETGLVYLANPPAQEQYCEEFAWEVTHADESARRQREEPLVYAASRAFKSFRHRWLKRDKLVGMLRGIACRRPAGPIRLVDIGCSDGGLFRRLVARLPAEVAGRIEPVGIEISTQLAATANQRLRFHGGRCIHAAGIEGLGQLASGSVHVVILSCVLEHELDPVALLAGCRERLATDGVVVVKVPNYGCLARHVRGQRWCGSTVGVPRNSEPFVADGGQHQLAHEGRRGQLQQGRDDPDHVVQRNLAVLTVPGGRLGRHLQAVVGVQVAQLQAGQRQPLVPEALPQGIGPDPHPFQGPVPAGAMSKCRTSSPTPSLA
jgi:2-polyprenyl-3-methyl-5-hydroxy-6-metoxy-1,4-benzoquinol methylase